MLSEQMALWRLTRLKISMLYGDLLMAKSSVRLYIYISSQLDICDMYILRKAIL